ncbi:hypothetical protein H0H87_011679 [Tephrocybe sp. NHM501043]|nr:hypothetical protein H0H87_011679 [Tephrocybe sp. NHM501043]
MVLSKRKRDGEFFTWSRAGEAPAPAAMLEIPAAKKARTSSKASSVSLTPAPGPSLSSKKRMQTGQTSPYTSEVSYLPPRAETLPQVSRGGYDMPSSSQPGPSKPSKGGRSRKKADADAPKPEKRGAIFKKSCPKNILDRVERVMSQRFFMIDRQRLPGELRETFSVLGSTGNVYTVTIDHIPHCPDALKGNHCKHILFIFLKVLQVTQASGIWYQKALLTSELERVFAQAPDAPNSLANPRIREAHARAMGKATTATTSAETLNKKRVPGPDDDCPICYEGMHGVSETSLIFCEECGNALHKQCFDQCKYKRVLTTCSLITFWLKQGGSALRTVANS